MAMPTNILQRLSSVSDYYAFLEQVRVMKEKSATESSILFSILEGDVDATKQTISAVNRLLDGGDNELSFSLPASLDEAGLGKVYTIVSHRTDNVHRIDLTTVQDGQLVETSPIMIDDEFQELDNSTKDALQKATRTTADQSARYHAIESSCTDAILVNKSINPRADAVATLSSEINRASSANQPAIASYFQGAKAAFQKGGVPDLLTFVKEELSAIISEGESVTEESGLEAVSWEMKTYFGSSIWESVLPTVFRIVGAIVTGVSKILGAVILVIGELFSIFANLAQHVVDKYAAYKDERGDSLFSYPIFDETLALSELPNDTMVIKAQCLFASLIANLCDMPVRQVAHLSDGSVVWLSNTFEVDTVYGRVCFYIANYDNENESKRILSWRLYAKANGIDVSHATVWQRGGDPSIQAGMFFRSTSSPTAPGYNGDSLIGLDVNSQTNVVSLTPEWYTYDVLTHRAYRDQQDGKYFNTQWTGYHAAYASDGNYIDYDPYLITPDIKDVAPSQLINGVTDWDYYDLMYWLSIGVNSIYLLGFILNKACWFNPFGVVSNSYIHDRALHDFACILARPLINLERDLSWLLDIQRPPVADQNNALLWLPIPGELRSGDNVYIRYFNGHLTANSPWESLNAILTQYNRSNDPSKSFLKNATLSGYLEASSTDIYVNGVYASLRNNDPRLNTGLKIDLTGADIFSGGDHANASIYTSQNDLCCGYLSSECLIAQRASDFFVQPPKYTANALINTILISVAVVAGVAAITSLAIVAKFKVKNHMAKRLNRIEAAKYAWQDDPDNDEKWKDYKRQCRRYNLLASVTGYDKVSYMDGYTYSSEDLQSIDLADDFDAHLDRVIGLIRSSDD